MDNGPKFIAVAVAAWAEAHGVALDFIQPGRPAQNASASASTRRTAGEVLDIDLFTSLAEVRASAADWLRRYNTEWPTTALARCRRSRSC
jgi:putative transposase